MDLRLLDKALYFVSMPGYNKSSTSINPDPKSDYYCGANAGKPSTNTSAEGGRGNYCPELDVLEANKFAVQSTCTDHGFGFCVVFSSQLQNLYKRKHLQKIITDIRTASKPLWGFSTIIVGVRNPGSHGDPQRTLVGWWGGTKRSR